MNEKNKVNVPQTIVRRAPGRSFGRSLFRLKTAAHFGTETTSEKTLEPSPTKLILSFDQNSAFRKFLIESGDARNIKIP